MRISVCYDKPVEAKGHVGIDGSFTRMATAGYSLQTRFICHHPPGRDKTLWETLTFWGISVRSTFLREWPVVAGVFSTIEQPGMS